MHLKHLIEKLRHAPNDPDRARELAQLAFMEWLGALPGDASFPVAAMTTFDGMRRAAEQSEATAEFRALLAEAVRVSPMPLALPLRPSRRGGRRARRVPF
ncbi:MAG: hypothetical protein AAGJ91_14800 [Pseudomonadota bacterium]